MKGQPLYGCLTLHYGIWKTIIRKINSQVKIRQIVKLNDTNVIKTSDEFHYSESKTDFFQISGCITMLVKH